MSSSSTSSTSLSTAPAVPWPKRTRRLLRAQAILFVLWCLGLLPLGLACALGRALGRLGFHVIARERRRALAHLAIAFPERSESERRRLARETFAHLGQCAAEIAQERTIDRRLEELVQFGEEDRRVLDEALAAGKGAIIVTGHIGNWELLARRVAHHRGKISVVARELNAPALTDAMDGYRARGKVATLWRGRAGATREMLRVFRENGILGLLIDQDTKVQSVFVPFFGRDASTPRAAGDLAARTGAALIGAFIRREGALGHRIRMVRIDAPRTGDRDEDGVRLTAAATRVIEDAIRQAPAEWVWMHERWKARPEIVSSETAG